MSQELFQIGIARRVITPPSHVELAGLGYYLGRKAERVRDNLNATALVIGDKERSIAVVAVDLMCNDVAFTGKVREFATAETDLQPDAICVNFSHRTMRLRPV